MNKTELASSVATRTSITRATADSARRRGIRHHCRGAVARRKGLHRRLRDLCHPESAGAPGPQPRDRGEHRHRRLHGAVVQGRQDAPRCRQPAIGVKPPDGRSARNRPVHPEPPLLSGPMFVAGRRRREICNSSPVRTHVRSRVDLESPCARVLYNAAMRIALDDKTTPTCAPVEATAFPSPDFSPRGLSEAALYAINVV